jgi:DNA-binding response OmpR family regulator
MKKKVLLVEDDLDISRMYQFNFAESDFLVNIATNGRECLEALGTDIPDVIVLDLKMPVMDGFQVLRRLRAEPTWQGIPVVVLSSREADDEVKQALDLGATDFFVKYRSRPEGVVVKVQHVLARPAERRVAWRYRLPVSPDADETARLITDFGLPYKLQCTECGQALVLEIVPDLSREAPWFTGHFVCSHCDASRSSAPAPAERGATHGESSACRR